MKRKHLAHRRRRMPFKLRLKKTTVYTFSTVSLFSLAGIIIVSFSRQGRFLHELNYVLFHYFGWGTFFLPFLLVMAGLIMIRLPWKILQPRILVGAAILSLALMMLFQTGVVGFEFWQDLANTITTLGAFIVASGLAFVGFVITFNTSIEEIYISVARLLSLPKGKTDQLKNLKNVPGEKAFVTSAPEPEMRRDFSKVSEGTEKGPGIVIADQSLPAINMENGIWEYPPTSLLADVVSGKADRGDTRKNAETIESTLESFGVTARVAEINKGPAVTQYAIEITLGTKLSKITSLSTDLALALAAPTGQIRIEAPIPGRSLVGVEVPNRSPEFVGMKQMLTSEKAKQYKSKLTIALGLNVAGQPIFADIAKMPHVLIAGATGSGKSVCIHSIIDAILFRATPAEVKFIFVDPKRVELTQYNGIPHLLTPVIVEPDKVVSALKWAISEMEKRYKLFAEMGARNVESYNEMSGINFMHYIVIVIDELADIMLFAPGEVEDSICRIAQMARATGIHLIVSTQRPSVDVITGLIKANIPCRIAFNVSSQIDSRVIIDSPGAEKLLGRGDMLFVPPDQAKPTRIQGTFVSDQEINRLIAFLKKTGVAPAYTEEVTKAPANRLVGGQVDPAEKDGFFDEAVRIICQYDRASASLLQRRLKVGYARAARILDQLEQAQAVGPAEGSKPREVLIKDAEEYLAGNR